MRSETHHRPFGTQKMRVIADESINTVIKARGGIVIDRDTESTER